MAVELAARLDVQGSVRTDGELPTSYTGVAVHEAGQWASICPELDIASVGPNAEEAIENLAQAVREALAYASDHGTAAGQPTPPQDLRSFIISSDQPFYVRRFYV